MKSHAITCLAARQQHVKDVSNAKEMTQLQFVIETSMKSHAWLQKITNIGRC
jgi:hypothetical protein